MSAASSPPTIAELRAATQPQSIFERNSGEHWAGRLYIRRLSPYLTRALIPTRISPNGVTWLMLACGVLAAFALAIPSVWASLAAVLLIQLQILLDCSDGELARWRQRFSPAGIYLDRLAHFVTETAFPIALGIRAGGGDYLVLGLIAALLALFVRVESALVAVARLESGRGAAPDTAAFVAPRGGLLRRARRIAANVPFFRAFIAMEATLLALAAAVVDAFADSSPGTKALVIALVPLAALTAVLRLAAILSSDRLT